jgi:hypothetical protein
MSRWRQKQAVKNSRPYAASAACDTAGLCLALEQIYRQLLGPP